MSFRTFLNEKNHNAKNNVLTKSMLTRFKNQFETYIFKNVDEQPFKVESFDVGTDKWTDVKGYTSTVVKYELTLQDDSGEFDNKLLKPIINGIIKKFNAVLIESRSGTYGDKYVMEFHCKDLYAE